MGEEADDVEDRGKEVKEEEGVGENRGRVEDEEVGRIVGEEEWGRRAKEEDRRGRGRGRG